MNMTEETNRIYRGPGGIGRWVWWYVIVMLIAMVIFAVMLMLQ